MSETQNRAALSSAWSDFDDRRTIVAVDDTSPRVSTNSVYRLTLSDRSHVYAKVSSYGSYFLFAEDHDRLFRCTHLLAGTRFENFLAPVLGKSGRPFTWYDGQLWVAFYAEAPKRHLLPPQLSLEQSQCLAREIAEFHVACDAIAPAIPATSNSIKADAIHLLDLLSSPFAPRNFSLPPEHIGVLWKHTHDFLMELENIRYDSWTRIPVLVDWNLGNFSVRTRDDAPRPQSHEEDFHNGSFSLFSRWDYDWFRVESRLLDFYFLSRVSSATGDQTQWTYSPHTLVEPQFVAFVRAYHQIFPLSEADIRFLPEAYRFFILNYVVREGARFFRPDLCTKFRSHAARTYLPSISRLDLTPLLRAISS